MTKIIEILNFNQFEAAMASNSEKHKVTLLYKTGCGACTRFIKLIENIWGNDFEKIQFYSCNGERHRDVREFVCSFYKHRRSFGYPAWLLVPNQSADLFTTGVDACTAAFSSSIKNQIFTELTKLDKKK